MYIEISVSKQDIVNGWSHDERYCPIARAVQRAFERKYRRRKVQWVAVGAGKADVYLDNDNRYIAKLPKHANEFIGQFDSGSAIVRPFKTRLNFR